MFCENCGKQLNDNDIFCTQCGHKMLRPDTSSPENVQNKFETKNMPVHKQKSNKGIIIAICICLVVLIASAALIIMTLGTGSDDTDTKSKDYDSSKSYSASYKKDKKSAKKSNQEVLQESQEKTELIIGYTNYVPFSYYENGVLTGFDVELAKYVCEKLGLTPVFEEISWDGKEILLKSGDIDCVWNGMSYTSERDEEMSLSQVYAENYYYSSELGTTACDHMVIGFKKGSELTEKVDEILSQAQEDGTIDAIAQKYLFYRVRLSVHDSASQIGAFIDFDKAKDLADSKAGEGYKVYNSLNNLVYEP